MFQSSHRNLTARKISKILGIGVYCECLDETKPNTEATMPRKKAKLHLGKETSGRYVPSIPEEIYFSVVLRWLNIPFMLRPRSEVMQ